MKNFIVQGKRLHTIPLFRFFMFTFAVVMAWPSVLPGMRTMRAMSRKE